MNPMYYILIGVIALVVAIDLYLKKKNKKSESTDVEKFSDNVFAKEPKKFNLLLLIGGGLIVFTVAFFLTDKFVYDGRLSDNSDSISLIQNLTFEKVYDFDLEESTILNENDVKVVMYSLNDSPINAIVFDTLDNCLGIVINGFKDGTWKEYRTKNGQIWFTLDYKMGVRHGIGNTWDIDGNLFLTNIYQNGEKTLQKSFYANGQKEEEQNFKNGERHGPSKAWYENGQIKSEKVYSNKYVAKGSYYDKWSLGFHKVGIFKEWYENGQLKTEGRVNDYNQLDGIYSEYYENGQIKSSQFYKNGRKDGLQSYYRVNGSLEETVNYRYSHPEEYIHGFYRLYDEKDVITDEVYYQMGSCISVSHYRNGEKFQVTHYLDNSENCEEKYMDYVIWYKNGDRKQKQNYKNGKPYGKRIYY